MNLNQSHPARTPSTSEAAPLSSFASSLALSAALAFGLAAQADDGPKESGISAARQLSNAFRDAAEKTLPAVVTILGREENKEQPMLNIIGGPDEQVYSSVGSGVIISDDGLRADQSPRRR